MSETEKKGITVKIDADLHAQIRQYIEANGMTMTEFVSKALDDELHPKTTTRATVRQERISRPLSQARDSSISFQG